MYRSSSWSRVSDDYYSSPKAGSTPGLRMSSSAEDNDELPMYDPTIQMAMKEKSRTKFTENAVHIIPLVLLVCALVLWFFSNPDVEMGTKVTAARIEGLTIDGDIDTDSDGTQTGFLPIVDVGDIDTTKQPKAKIPSRKLQNYDLNS